MYKKNQSFTSFYKECKVLFENAFVELKGSNNTFTWPVGSGVYVIWNGKPSVPANLIYIGMTGKFSRNVDNTILFNGNQFKHRISRWTPYRFCESVKDGEYQYSFRYGPKYPKVEEQSNHKYDPDAYCHIIPYNELHIDCFIINADHPTLTPASLEAILLTKYLKEVGDLPPANNSL